MEHYPHIILPGFVIPLHRALTEPILLGGAPRSFAILNGTIAAVIGLGLKFLIAAFLFWSLGHSLGVIAARHDPLFLEVLLRHLKHRKDLGC